MQNRCKTDETLHLSCGARSTSIRRSGQGFQSGELDRPDVLPIVADGSYPFAFPLDFQGAGHLDGGAPHTLHMQNYVMPRHGSGPNRVTLEAWPRNKRLPGGINVSFFDGHTEFVPLERLWGLGWHKNYPIGRSRP